MNIIGLFSGIGGLELGFRSAGHSISLVADIDPDCRRVLRARFPESRVVGEIADLPRLPFCDVLTAGFPCQPYSQAGATRGLADGRALLEAIFRLIDSRPPQTLLFENVPFIRHLHEGAALGWLLKSIEDRGYDWAYRTIDAMAFGTPQRRKRWFLLASKTFDPATALLAPDSKRPMYSSPSAFGFYWTEGSRGIGWAPNAIPPLRVGSSLGIPSPPAIWRPSVGFGLPDIRDAERLQGFPVGWTDLDVSPGARWRLIGNAVNACNARWIADRCAAHSPPPTIPRDRVSDETLPTAAFSIDRKRYAAHVGDWPVEQAVISIDNFLRYPMKDLSVRAATGFLNRYRNGTLRKNARFMSELRAHIR